MTTSISQTGARCPNRQTCITTTPTLMTLWKRPTMHRETPKRNFAQFCRRQIQCLHGNPMYFRKRGRYPFSFPSAFPDLFINAVFSVNDEATFKLLFECFCSCCFTIYIIIIILYLYLTFMHFRPFKLCTYEIVIQHIRVFLGLKGFNNLPLKNFSGH